jgi:CPA2 family monovalent cation:H+ antiporter-2
MDTLPLILLLLGASVVGVFLCRRAGLPPVLGYLSVGAVLAAVAATATGPIEKAGLLAEFGVVFLMFTLGLEFSLPRLMAMQRLVFGLGLAQLVATMLLVGALVMATGLPWQAALVMSAVVTMSSTAVLAKLLADRGAVDTSWGRAVFGVLLFQDLAVLPLLIVMPALSASPGEMAALLAFAALKAILALALVLRFGQRMMAAWLHFVARGKSTELFVLNVLLMTLGLAWLTHLAGLSMALGAFVAGMLISETEYRHQVEEDIKPFRDVLLGFFFVTVGMQLQVEVLVGQWYWILAVLLGLLAIKGAVVWGVARLFLNSAGDRLRTALWLCAGGEFGFVLITEARRVGAVADAPLQILLAALVLSLFLAPFIVHYSEKIVLRLVSSEWMLRSMQLTRIASQSMSNESHAIICGFGRAGQHLARFLAQEGVSSVALDLDPDRVREAGDAGESVVFGDATRRETLVAAGVKRASVVVVTFGDIASAEKVLAHVHELRPELPVVVRALDETVLDRLYAAGATEVVPEAIESSLMLASHALVLVGVPASRVLHRIREARQQRYRFLRGLFRGAVAEADGEGAPRLRSVAIPPAARSIGKTLGQLGLDAIGVEVSAIRRRGIRATDPSADTEVAAGDVVVLLGTPEALALAEDRLLKGG